MTGYQLHHGRKTSLETEANKILLIDDRKTSKDAQKITEDVPNNSEVLKKMIMLHRDLRKSEILGKIWSFTHFSWTFRFSYWFEFTYFGKVCQLGLK